MPTVNAELGAASVTGYNASKVDYVNAELGAASVTGYDGAVVYTVSPTAGTGYGYGQDAQAEEWGGIVAQAGYAVAYGHAPYADEVRTGPADQRRTVLVDVNGTTVATLGNAIHGPVTRRLNDHDAASFVLPVTDPDVALIAGTTGTRFREVQLWRGPDLLMWGPIVDWSLQGDLVSFSVLGASWHLTRRRVGPLEPVNYSTNGSFELGFTGWNFAKSVFFLTYATYSKQDARGITPTADVALVTVDASSPYDGSTALRLDGDTTYEFDNDLFAWQEITVSGGTQGRRCTLSARGWLQSSGLGGYSAFNRGVMLERLPTDFNQGGPNGGKMGWYTDPIEWRSSRIDEDTPTDQWVEHVATIDIAAGATEVLHLRLNSVNGVILWDDVRLDLEDRFEVYQSTQATIVSSIVEHAQSSTYGHTDANIDVLASGAAGPTRDLVALHAEQAECWQLIANFTRYDDGIDVRSRYTATGRWVEVGHPRLGAVRADRPLWTHGPVVALLSASGNGANAANAVAVRADNTEAPAWGSASQTSAFADSQVHEVSSQASIEATRNDLDADATELLAASVDPLVFSVALDPAVIDTYLDVRPGDWCPTNVVSGALSIVGTFRVTAVEVAVDDSLRIDLASREAPS